jgi:EF-hand domain-containing protein 1
MTSLSKSYSAPGILKLGTEMPKLGNHPRKATFGFKTGFLNSAVDLYKGPTANEEAVQLATLMKTPGWRSTFAEQKPPPPPAEEDLIPKNMRYPRICPAWLKHDKQVLRFYGFFQESVVERADENSRYRQIAIMYFMEDGTIRISEPRVENSGIAQGMFLKRHRVPRDDGMGFIGPDDFRCGQEITIYDRTYHISGCDRFTRWFYEENGIELGDDEPVVEDNWQRTYKHQKTAEKGGLPLTKSAVDFKALTKSQTGAPVVDKKLTQFLLNDRKVLRFKAFWDDHTLYGARTYLVIHYYLADNSIEINMAFVRNSGRDKYPVFMKRGQLHKSNVVNAVPAMLSAESSVYMPEDLKVGDSIDVWNRKVILYDCDDFTRKFYQDYLGIDQFEGRIDVSEKPVRHLKLAPPPHNGIGSEEDSLISTQMIVPKAPKVDLVKMMTMSGEVLRFECKMVNGEPEDELRRLVIAFYPADDEVMVCEIQQRNSGHMGGKFAEKRKQKNPDTGKYFQLTDFFVGQTVTIAAQPLQIIRADEHCLQFLEARPDQFPYADPYACARRLAPLANEPEMNDPHGIDPDRLKELAADAGCPVVDHEVITLLRRFGREGPDGNPLIVGPTVLEAATFG